MIIIINDILLIIKIIIMINIIINVAMNGMLKTIRVITLHCRARGTAQPHHLSRSCQNQALAWARPPAGNRNF